MLTFQSGSIYLHRDPVDFRKSINGLTAVVQESMELDVFSKSLFVFGNRNRTKVKILFWDKTGFCLLYKRLEKDKFKWPRNGEFVLHLSSEQFDWLLRGLDISKLTPHTEKYFISTV
jgi:transposase